MKVFNVLKNIVLTICLMSFAAHAEIFNRDAQAVLKEFDLDVKEKQKLLKYFKNNRPEFPTKELYRDYVVEQTTGVTLPQTNQEQSTTLSDEAIGEVIHDFKADIFKNGDSAAEWLSHFKELNPSSQDEVKNYLAKYYSSEQNSRENEESALSDQEIDSVFSIYKESFEEGDLLRLKEHFRSYPDVFQNEDDVRDYLAGVMSAWGGSENQKTITVNGYRVPNIFEEDVQESVSPAGQGSVAGAFAAAGVGGGAKVVQSSSQGPSSQPAEATIAKLPQNIQDKMPAGLSKKERKAWNRKMSELVREQTNKSKFASNIEEPELTEAEPVAVAPQALAQDESSKKVEVIANSNFSEEALKLFPEYVLHRGIQNRIPEAKQTPRVRISPIHNALIRGFLHYFDIEISADSDGVLSGKSRTIENKAMRWQGLLKWLEVVRDTYAVKQVKLPQNFEVKSAAHALFLNEPTRGWGRGVDKTVERALKAYNEGKLPTAVEADVFKDPNVFLEENAVSSRTIFSNYLRVLLAKHEQVADLVIHGQSANNVGSEILAAIMNSIYTSAVGSLSGLSIALRGGADGIEKFGQKNKFSNAPVQTDPNERFTDQLAKGMRGTADAADKFQDGLMSEEGVLELIEKILEQDKTKPMAVSNFFSTLEKNINRILSDSLTTIPEQLMKNAFAKSSRRSMHQRDQTVYSRVMDILFTQYLPELPPEILRDIFFDLITIDPSSTDEDCFDLLVSRYLPLITNFLQHISSHSDIEVVRAVGKKLTDSGLEDSPYVVMADRKLDPMNYNMVEVDLEDEMAVQAVIEKYGQFGEETDESGKKRHTLINFDPYAFQAGKLYQAHIAHVVHKGKLLKVVVRCQKQRMAKFVDYDAKILSRLSDRLAGVIRSDLNPDKFASDDAIKDFMQYMHGMINTEKDPVGTVENHRIMDTRFTKSVEVDVNGKKIRVNIKGAPFMFESVPGATSNVMEFIESVSRDELASTHPEVFKEIGKVIYKTGSNEVFWNQIMPEHELVSKIVAWGLARNIVIDPAKIFDESLENFGGISDKHLEFKLGKLDFISDPEITLREYLQSRRNAQLDFGLLPGDPHVGNILFHPVEVKEGVITGGATLIDNAMLAWLKPEHKTSIYKAMVGISLKDVKILGEAIADLAINDKNIKDSKFRKAFFKNVKDSKFRKIILNDVKKIIAYDKEGKLSNPGDWIYELRLFHDVKFPVELFQLYQPSMSLFKLFLDAGNSAAEDEAEEKKLVAQHRGHILSRSGVSKSRAVYSSIVHRCGSFLNPKN